MYIEDSGKTKTECMRQGQKYLEWYLPLSENCLFLVDEIIDYCFYFSFSISSEFSSSISIVCNKKKKKKKEPKCLDMTKMSEYEYIHEQKTIKIGF